jgi:DnaJ-class molecular chaperone
MTYKDYYRILDLDKGANSKEIKKAYRRLALLNHPDRNPEKDAGEERFKEISEAYGVLIDPKKRQEYDQLHQTETDKQRKRQEFRYSQEEIFRDIFKDHQASDIFRDLKKEFGKFGFRFDEGFFNRLFFGRRGTFFGGLFFFGTFSGGNPFKLFGAGRTQTVKAQPGFFLPKLGKEAVGRIARRAGKLLLGAMTISEDRTKKIPGLSSKKGKDITYSISITPEGALSGTKLRIAYSKDGKMERVHVRVPPGTKDGTKLRLQGKGSSKGGSIPGDLYLHVNIN